MADILLYNASFYLGETARQDVLAKSRTYAVPWPSRTWAVSSEKLLDTGQMEKTGRPCQSFEELQSHLTACCSSIACSASATRLGWHKGLQVDSPGLTEDVRRVARVWRRAEPQVRSGEDESAAWREVLAHGAPQALGDAFLAAVAAVARVGASQARRGHPPGARAQLRWSAGPAASTPGGRAEDTGGDARL